MLHQAFLVVQLLVAVTYAAHQKYPGTSTRPVLSDAEAKGYTKEAYLQGWTPSSVKTSSADYVVGSGGYATIQAAVNAAITAGGTTRKYIKIEPGTYAQAILIPQTSVPLTIYGTPGSPGDVHIKLSMPASMTGDQYASLVNPHGAVFKEGDPAWSMYNGCAKRTTTIGICAAVVWAHNDNFELAYVTLENPSIQAQALAAKADGDKQIYDNVHFYGFQDTLFAGGKRLYFKKTTIKGDVDFIYGGGSAVFDSGHIIARADRPRNTAVIFAPNTDSQQKYGYLVINSKITAESAIKTKKGCSLARAWDASSSASPNGQVVIRETEIDDVINVLAPYATAAGGREYAGNANTNRNLDDPHYNRFWEYKNTGGGA